MPSETPKKRLRIPYKPPSIVLSSDQLETDEPEIPIPEADVTAEDLLLLGDPDLDQDGGEDELLGNEQYLDDTDLDDDPLNESSGRRFGSGSDLDMPDDDLDSADLPDEEDDFFGLPDDEESAWDEDESKL